MEKRWANVFLNMVATSNQPLESCLSFLLVRSLGSFSKSAEIVEYIREHLQKTFNLNSIVYSPYKSEKTTTFPPEYRSAVSTCTALVNKLRNDAFAPVT
jgi:hypothetical protein